VQDISIGLVLHGFLDRHDCGPILDAQKPCEIWLQDSQGGGGEGSEDHWGRGWVVLMSGGSLKGSRDVWTYTRCVGLPLCMTNLGAKEKR